MDSEIVGRIDMDDIRVDAMSFSWAVDTALRSESETASNLGATPPHSFASEVDGAIRSSGATEADLGISPVHGFASAVDMRAVTARVFTLAELKAATNNFSRDNIIGAGSHTVVYRGKLVDGREVVIKRGETSTWRRSATKSELASFSNLHNHNNLVWLVGFFCEERYEMLLVYEYMKNGSLYDCLHDSSVLNSWKMRIKIALDASRGIQYLHNYADPSIVHGHIKSSNILLDATWTARVSDVELTFMKKRAGTVGYIDPDLNVLTAKSDVNGLGIVLLELLTGKTPIFEYRKDEEDGGWKHVVDFAVPDIMAGELVKILDPGVVPPDVNEAKAVELVAYTAMRCVNSKDSPTMADIVVNLERALAVCDSSPHDNISSDTVSDVSE